MKNHQRNFGLGNGDETSLDEAQAHNFRATAVCANLLALDRPDLAFATKELCRRMSAPTEADTSALRRVSRYLLSAPRLVYEFPWQSDANLDVLVERISRSVWPLGGAPRGEASLRGLHLIKHWSLTQKAVTLSSAATWDPECYPRPWPKHDTELASRFGESWHWAGRMSAARSLSIVHSQR